MATNLYAASEQWSKRPDDERFWTLEEMHDRCQHYAESARQAIVDTSKITIAPTPSKDNLMVCGPAGNPATLTHWSFGQLCGRASAPAGYLRGLPAPLAADCLNAGLARSAVHDRSNVLFHANGSLVCRAFLTDSYARIWNHEIVSRLLPAQEQGWRVPPARPSRDGQAGSRPATEADCIDVRMKGLGIQPGDLIAPAGLYASDHDMFAFMVNEENRIEDGSDGGLSRGFFVTNSEVGAAALKVTKFLYRHVCGNHIVWDAKDVSELRIVHTGSNDRRYGYKLQAELRMYANESQDKDRARVESARRFELGSDKEKVLDALFAKRILPRKTLEAAYDYAVDDNSGGQRTSPRTVWGMVQGITRLSQDSEYTENRVELDRAAGKVLSIAF